MDKKLIQNNKLELLNSVRQNDIEKIISLVEENGVDLLNGIYEDFGYRNILQVACYYWPDEIISDTVKILIEQGIDLYYCNELNSGSEALHFAAISYNPEILRPICDHIRQTCREKINSPCQDERSALYLLAADKKNYNHPNFMKCVDILINSGVDVNKANVKHFSPILMAAKNNNGPLVKVLLQQPNIDIENHKFLGKSAKNFIEENNLIDDALLASCTNNIDPKTRCVMLLKEGNVEEFTKELPIHKVDEDDGYQTLLQIACSKGLAQAVEKLLELKADVNKTTKKNPKTPIEIAANEGYFKIFEMLIQNHSVVLPKNLLNILLIHIDNFETEIRSNKKCFDTLMDYLDELPSDSPNKLDVNYRNQNGTSSLHYAALYADSERILRLLRCGAFLGNKNKYDAMPLDEIEAHILEEFWDTCIKIRKSDEILKATFNYKSFVNKNLKRNEHRNYDEENLNSTDYDLDNSETELLVRMACNRELRPVLKHPIVSSFLFIKWHQLRWFFYINLIFYTLFCLSLYLYIWFNYDVENRGELNSFLIGTTAMLFFREGFQAFISWRNYLLELDNLIEVSLIMITIVMLSLDSRPDDGWKQISATVILLSAFELVMLIGQFPALSAKIVMLRKVCWNFFKCFLLFAVLIIAFAFSFTILFDEHPDRSSTNTSVINGDDEEDFFENPAVSIFKTFIMMTGEFDSSSINFNKFPYISHAVFIMFLFIIAIVLYNLINGLAVSDIQQIESDALLHDYVTRIHQINYVEKMLFSNSFFIRKTTFLRRLTNKIDDYKEHRYETDLNTKNGILRYWNTFYLGEEIINRTRRIWEKQKQAKNKAEQKKMAVELKRMNSKLDSVIKQLNLMQATLNNSTGISS